MQIELPPVTLDDLKRIIAEQVIMIERQRCAIDALARALVDRPEMERPSTE